MTIRFDNGNTKIVTNDARVTISTSGVSGNGVLSVGSGTIEATSGVGTVRVTLIWDSSAVATSFDINIIDASALDLTLRPYPSYTGSSSVQTNELKEIENTGKYQRAKAEVILTLSDGTTHDVSTSSTVTTSDANVVEITEPNKILSTEGMSAVGSFATIGAQFGTLLATSNQTLAVSGNKALVTDLSFSTFSSDTLSLIVDRSTYLSVRVTFDDATVFENARTSTSSWISITEYLSFASSKPSLATIDSFGSVTVKSNSDKDQVSVNVTSLNTYTSYAFDTNLLADVGDVDVGAVVGSPYPVNLQSGDTFSVSVRANTNQALKQFEIYLQFDDNVLRAVSVSTGSDWSPYVQSSS